MTNMKRNLFFLPSAVALLLGNVASAAQFKPDGGGNLDDASNWTAGYSTFAIYKQLTGPLTISADGAVLPGTGDLLYGNGVYCNTNMFTAGWTLNLAGKTLRVNGGSTLVHLSGKIQAGGDSLVQAGQADMASAMIFSGTDSVFGGESLQTRVQGSPAEPVKTSIVFTNGASAVLSGALVMNGGYNATDSLFTGEGTSLTASLLSMGDQESDQPGVQRTLAFDDGATATLAQSSTIGTLSGGNNLVISGGSAVTFGSALYITDGVDNVASSNNTVTVDGGSLVLGGDLCVGLNALATNNAVYVRNGGNVQILSGHVAVVGYQGAANALVAEGSGTVVDCTGGKVLVGGRSSGVAWNNAIKVLDGAVLHAGEELDIGILGGGNTVLVSNATMTARYVSNYSSGNEFRAVASTIVVTNGFANALGYSGLRASFDDCDVMFAMNTSSYAGVGGNDAHISFKDSRVRFPNRFNPSGVGFEMAFDNTEVDFPANEWFMTGAQSDANNASRYVLSGTNTHIRISGSKGLYLRGSTVVFEFRIPADGVSRQHPMLDIQHSSGAVSADPAGCESSLVVNVDPLCVPGLYTLIKGKNCTTKFTNYICNSQRAKIVKTQVDGVDAVQVRVFTNGTLLIYR